jgi:hypothetical protein
MLSSFERLAHLARALFPSSAPVPAPIPPAYAIWSSRAEVVALAGVRPYLRGEIGAVRVVVIGEVAGVVCALLRVSPAVAGEDKAPSVMVRVRIVAWGDFERAIEAGGVEGARGVKGVRYGV